MTLGTPSQPAPNNSSAVKDFWGNGNQDNNASTSSNSSAVKSFWGLQSGANKPTSSLPVSKPNNVDISKLAPVSPLNLNNTQSTVATTKAMPTYFKAPLNETISATPASQSQTQNSNFTPQDILNNYTQRTQDKYMTTGQKIMGDVSNLPQNVGKGGIDIVGNSIGDTEALGNAIYGGLDKLAGTSVLKDNRDYLQANYGNRSIQGALTGTEAPEPDITTLKGIKQTAGALGGGLLDMALFGAGSVEKNVAKEAIGNALKGYTPSLANKYITNSLFGGGYGLSNSMKNDLSAGDTVKNVGIGIVLGLGATATGDAVSKLFNFHSDFLTSVAKDSNPSSIFSKLKSALPTVDNRVVAGISEDLSKIKTRQGVSNYFFDLGQKFKQGLSNESQIAGETANAGSKLESLKLQAPLEAPVESGVKVKVNPNNLDNSLTPNITPNITPNTSVQNFWNKTAPITNPINNSLTNTPTSPLQAPTSPVEPSNSQTSTPNNNSNSLESEAKKYKSADEFIKSQPKLFHSGASDIKEVKLGKSNFQKTFYMTDDATYSKSYGGSKSSLNEIVLDSNAKMADLRKPSESIIKDIDNIISSKPTGETVKIQRPDGSFINVDKMSGGVSDGVYTTKQIIQGLKEGKALFAELPEVKIALKKLGYDGAITQESKFGANYGVWNKDVIKTKSQLTDIWNKANKETKLKLPTTDPKEFEFDMSKEDAHKAIRKLFTPEEAKLMTGDNPTIVKAAGLTGTEFADQVQGFFNNEFVGVIENGGKVQSFTLYHESGHKFFNTFLSPAKRKKYITKILNEKSSELVKYDSKAYPKPEDKAEEWLMDDFAKRYKENANFNTVKDGYLKSLYKRILKFFKDLLRKKDKFEKFYDRVKSKDRSYTKPTKRTITFSKLKIGEDPRPITLADKLMAEGKIRVSSRDGKDVYMIKKGGEWVKVRDEDSAVRQVTKTTLPKEVKSEPKSESKPLEVKTPPPLPQVSPIDTTTGEGRSLQILERQSKGVSPLESSVKNVSLPKSIPNTPTNVKNKVHFVDTLLTSPRFVMEKIGFGKEYRELRTAMDDYNKELPKKIDLIRNWKKEVPTKENNTDIFKYLDGEAIDLTPKEKKVADEIRAELDNLFNRQGMRKEQRITDYITHIGFGAGEFPESIANMIDDKIPGSVYSPFTLERLGAKGYKQDTWAALDAYFKRSVRKANLDPILEKIQARTGVSLDTSNLEKSVFKYIQKYINNVNMRPSDFDEGIDNLVKSIVGYKFGARPTSAGLRTLRKMTFRGALGLNLSSALRNLSQGINTYSELGEKYTVIGYAKMLNKGAMEELKREGVLDAGFIQDETLSATKKLLEKTDKVLFAAFNAMETVNRGPAYFGAKSQYLAGDASKKNVYNALGRAYDKKNLTEEDAIKFGKYLAGKTQFLFDSVDTPVGMSSDIMKTLFQFQSFTTKQIEFLGGKVKDSVKGDEKMRNILGLIRYTLGGFAFIYTIGRLFGMQPKELLPMYRIDTPVSIKLPVEVGKALLNTPDQYGQPRSTSQKLSDIGKASVTLFPAGSQAKKTYDGLKAVKESGSFDKSGKLQFPVGNTTYDKVQAILFGKYASPTAQNYFNKAEINSNALKEIKPVYDQAQALQAKGDTAGAQSLVDDLTDAQYEMYKKYSTAEKTKATVAAKTAMIPTYKEIQALNKTNPEEAQKRIDAMSDADYKTYTLVSKDFEKQAKAASGTQPSYADGSAQSEPSLINTIWTYAKAIGEDPATAFNRIFTGQRIKRVDNGTVIVERMSLKDSTAVKVAGGGNNSSMKLDHTIPLEIGGSNDKSNLKLVDTAVWASYTPVENYLGTQLRAGNITKKEAQDTIVKFKNGELSASDIIK